MHLRPTLLWLIFTSACVSVVPPAPEALRQPYSVCWFLSRGPAKANDALAQSIFHQARLDGEAGRYDAAAIGFMKAAKLQHDFLYNRRVAYANAVNTWLSAQHVEPARTAILTAAQTDPELAGELTAWAAALPNPARCVLTPL